jgi:hypothetical protein
VATARAASLATTQIRTWLGLVSAAGLSRRREQAYLGSQMSVMAGNSAERVLRCDCSLAPLLDARLLEIIRLASSLLTEMGICSSARLVGHLALGSLFNSADKYAKRGRVTLVGVDSVTGGRGALDVDGHVV